MSTILHVNNADKITDKNFISKSKWMLGEFMF